MTADQQHDQRAPLRSLLAYAERETVRRAKGVHPGMTRLQDAELAALLDLLRREVGEAEHPSSGEDRSSAPAAEPVR